MNCSPPGSSVRGILQARILEWVVIPFSKGSSWPRDQTCVSCTGKQILYHWATSQAHSGGSEVSAEFVQPTNPTSLTVQVISQHKCIQDGEKERKVTSQIISACLSYKEEKFSQKSQLDFFFFSLAQIRLHGHMWEILYLVFQLL